MIVNLSFSPEKGWRGFYKVSEVARMLNVSTIAVRKWIKSGKLRARRIGRLWMIPESEPNRFLGEKLEKLELLYMPV